MSHENLGPGQVEGGDPWDLGPEWDPDTDTQEWREHTHPEMLTILSVLDGTHASIHLDVKQEQGDWCAAYACVEKPIGTVRGIGPHRWCELHHDLVEILLIVKRGWAQGQDLTKVLAYYRKQAEAKIKERADIRAEEARIEKLARDRANQRARARRARLREELRDHRSRTDHD